MYFPKKAYVLLLKKIEIGSAIAVRLTKYTGKSKVFIHPKHFLNPNPWFTGYLQKKDLVLDLGSGNGQNAIKSSKYSKKVIGVEVDKSLIEIAQKSVNQKRIKNIKFYTGNLEEKLQFNNNSFNKVLFLDVLEHLGKRDEILTEIYRVLKPKGIIMVGVPNKASSWKKTQRSVGISSFSDPDHKIEFSKNDINKLLKKFKFKIIHFGYAPYDTPFRGFHDIIGSLSLSTYKKIYEWRVEKVKKDTNEASGFEIVAQKS